MPKALLLLAVLLLAARLGRTQQPSTSLFLPFGVCFCMLMVALESEFRIRTLSLCRVIRTVICIHSILAYCSLQYITRALLI